MLQALHKSSFWERCPPLFTVLHIVMENAQLLSNEYWNDIFFTCSVQLFLLLPLATTGVIHQPRPTFLRLSLTEKDFYLKWMIDCLNTCFVIHNRADHSTEIHNDWLAALEAVKLHITSNHCCFASIIIWRSSSGWNAVFVHLLYRNLSTFGQAAMGKTQL